MRIFTYFDPAVTNSPDQTGLLREWSASWSRWGWEPRVLTPATAYRHPGVHDYFARVSRYPTVNPRVYETACYMRWLALETSGGGWLTDYDVINRGFKPRRGTQAIEILNGVVWASKVGAPTITNLICTFNPRARDHVSDLLILKSRFSGSGTECVDFHSPGWERAPLVRFSSGQCARFPDKLTAIRSIPNA